MDDSRLPEQSSMASSAKESVELADPVPVIKTSSSVALQLPESIRKIWKVLLLRERNGQTVKAATKVDDDNFVVYILEEETLPLGPLSYSL